MGFVGLIHTLGGRRLWCTRVDDPSSTPRTITRIRRTKTVAGILGATQYVPPPMPTLSLHMSVFELLLLVGGATRNARVALHVVAKLSSCREARINGLLQ